jgi:hypothetical protein
MMKPIAFPIKRTDAGAHTESLDLPGPRIWTPKHLAEFLGVSVSWVYKRTQNDAEDPIPRVLGGAVCALIRTHRHFKNGCSASLAMPLTRVSMMNRVAAGIERGSQQPHQMPLVAVLRRDEGGGHSTG